MSLDLVAGKVTALLGPNGAGKTTAVRLLLGLSKPSAGAVHVLGGRPDDIRIRRRVGVMLQVARVPDTLTVREHLALFSSYYPSPRPLAESLAMCGLDAARDTRFGELSGGQRQRLLFAIALCGRPELVVLDEPTAGMDVAARRSVWSTIRRSVAGGCAVLLTTHHLDEADALADRVVVLKHGRVVADDTPFGLKRSIGSRQLWCRSSLSLSELSQLPGVTRVHLEPPRVCLVSDDTDRVLRTLMAEDPGVEDIDIVDAKLEEVFLSLTTTDPQDRPGTAGTR